MNAWAHRCSCHGIASQPKLEPVPLAYEATAVSSLDGLASIAGPSILGPTGEIVRGFDIPSRLANILLRLAPQHRHIVANIKDAGGIAEVIAFARIALPNLMGSRTE